MIARVILALDQSEPRKQLRRALARPDVLVEIAPSKTQLWQHLDEVTADLIVVSRSLLPDPPEHVLNVAHALPDAPGVVVIIDVDDPTEIAELLAAGCEAVLEASLPAESIAEVLDTLLERRREQSVQELAALQTPARPRQPLAKPSLSDFVSDSPVMQSFMATVRRVVAADVALLLLGETGVGKERLARAIHAESTRLGGPFVAVNCGALPETLLESELFGHEQGAFTGASRSRRGCFELAHGGTLFLDEVGEMPLHLQVKLLRVLQEHEIQRLGAEKTITVDVRIMAATNRDLPTEVANGNFRRDLFYRLGVVSLTVPPLRNRQDDIPELVDSYLDYLRPRIGREVRGITPDAVEAMKSYDWPGNVRELINVLERAMLLCEGQEITLLDLRDTLGPRAAPAMAAAALGGHGALAPLPPVFSEAWLAQPWHEVRTKALETLERAYLAGLLHETQGRVGQTAQRAGIQPRSLYEKMLRLGLRKEDFKA